jgi:hypothetical protein
VRWQACRKHSAGGTEGARRVFPGTPSGQGRGRGAASAPCCCERGGSAAAGAAEAAASGAASRSPSQAMLRTACQCARSAGPPCRAMPRSARVASSRTGGGQGSPPLLLPAVSSPLFGRAAAMPSRPEARAAPPGEPRSARRGSQRALRPPSTAAMLERQADTTAWRSAGVGGGAGAAWGAPPSPAPGGSGAQRRRQPCRPCRSHEGGGTPTLF